MLTVIIGIFCKHYGPVFHSSHAYFNSPVSCCFLRTGVLQKSKQMTKILNRMSFAHSLIFAEAKLEYYLN
jgi:hypothetical protein